jgi:hypothetical protein
MGSNLDIVVPAVVPALASAVADAHGRAWLVGGTVRDAVLGRPYNDLDLEVHGVEAATLEPILRRFGSVIAVGRSFGVFKLRSRGVELDVALPRASSHGGTRGEVAGDPHLGLAEATRRRDLTINAMAWDPLTGELEDSAGGLADARQGVLRAVDDSAFGDDVLRVWRVARFAGVLGFSVAPELVALCQSLDTSNLPPERVWGELRRLLLESPRPSAGLKAARATGTGRVWLSGVDARADTPVDRAAAYRDDVGRAPRPLGLMLGAMLGFADPVAVLERLRVITFGGWRLRDHVEAMVRLAPTLAGPVPNATLFRLAEVVELDLACRVSDVIHGGTAEVNRVRASMLGIAHEPLPKLISGKSLKQLGVPPGPAMGELIARVRQAQLAGEVDDTDGAIALAGRLWSESR